MASPEAQGGTPARTGEIRPVILGTAGHIDHGKSSLVRALTGVDPDRLEEERLRGMTIDLGFAPYVHRSGATVGVIDVPGHERFVRNMVAGATSIDIVLLVIAADDGVMPQTREHLQILQLLGVQRGLVVLTKVDAVDLDLVELAREDAAAVLRGTFLEAGPILPVSSKTGQGLPELRVALDDCIDAAPPRGTGGPFRLPVQRVFSVKGHGLVLTGVPVSGQVAPGDVLEIVGSGRSVRVRGVEAYGAERDVGRAGHSTALNLAGASPADVRRGDVVATPATFRRTRFITVDYQHVDAAGPLRQRRAVRFHAGTAEIMGWASLLDAEAVGRQTRAPVQVRLQEAVTVAPGDRMLLRDAASMRLLGGGTVVAVGEGRLKRFKQRVLTELEARRQVLGDPGRLAAAAIEAAGRRGRPLSELASEVGCPAAELSRHLADIVSRGALHQIAGELYVSPAALREVGGELVALLRDEHGRRPLLDWLELKDLWGRLGCSEPVLRAALADPRVETASGGRVRLRGHRARLGEDQRAARERVLATLAKAGPNPPPIDAAFTGLSEKDSRSLVDMLRRSGEVVAVGGHLFHPQALERMQAVLLAHGRAHGGEIEIPRLRDELGTTRKYLIPLLEYFDALGVTARVGERRVVRPRESD